MEKRLIAAIVLSFLVLFGYQALFNKPDKTPPRPQITATEAPLTPVPGTTAAVQEQKPAAAPESKPAAAEAAAPQDLTAVAAGAETDVVVETSLYRAVWSNKGGVLKSWALKKHKNSLKEKEGPRARSRPGRRDGALPLLAGPRGRGAGGAAQRLALPGPRGRARPRRRGQGRDPLRLFRRRLGPGREDVRLHRRQLRHDDRGPGLEGRPAGHALRRLGPWHRQPHPRRGQEELQRDARLGCLHRRQGLPDERAEIQARREHLQLRRLGRL